MVVLWSLCRDIGCLNINKFLMVFTAGLLGDDKDSGEGKYHCGSICLFYKGEAHLFNRNMTLL